MAQAQKKDFAMDDFEAKYNDITKLYDFAGQLLATVESPFARDPEEQIDIVEPLISEIGEATDALCGEFLLIAESKRYKTQSKASKAHIEAGLRRIFVAINDYNARVKDVTKKAHGAIMNIADPIVTKIQRQVEEVVAIFLEFMNLSLQSIMGQAALETLKARDTRIAIMMHQYALAQQHQG